MNTFSSQFRKNFLACLIGPLAIIPATVVYALAFKVIEPAANVDNFELVPFMALFGLLFAYPVTLLVGLPISLVLQRMHTFNFATLSVIVVLLAALYSFINSIQLLEFAFIIYFSIWVSSTCWYLHKVG